MDYTPTSIGASPNGYNLTVETPGLCVHIGIEGMETGIVPTLRTLGGFLFYGYMSPDKFLELNQNNWFNHLQNLSQAHTIDNNLKRRLSFYLMMCRLAVNEDWRYPALISRKFNGDLDQETGMSRAFATMIVRSEPWKHYPVLALEGTFCPPDFLDNPIRIDTDKDLHSVLKTQPTDGYNQQHLYFKIWNQDNRPYLRLNYISNGTFHDQRPVEAQILMEKFLAWSAKFPRPDIKVYTAWPEQVKNTGNFWNMELAGSTDEMINEIAGRPAVLDTMIRKFHIHQRPTLGDSYAIWIVNPRPFDLANFLPWMNLDANVLHDKNYDFIMYRADQDYVSQEISVYSHNL